MEKIAFGASDLDDLIEQSAPNFIRRIPYGTELRTIGGLINLLLRYIFPAAGILVLLYLAWGGFQVMLSGGNPKNIEMGKAKITNSIIGFVIIFVAYWIVQIVAIALGLRGTIENIF